MASNSTALSAAPSNFYLRNPIALLVGKECLKDSDSDDVVQTQLKLSTDSPSQSHNETGGSESKEIGATAFILNDTPAKQLVTELARLLDASQVKKIDGSDGEGGADGATSMAALNGAKRHTPYQILYSNTFQCYTSLAFYGALLVQLKAWVRQLDAGSARSRSLVWAHLFCLVGRDQTSSDPIAPVLQAIVSAPKMDLMDVELLYLAVLLASKLYPQLLSSASANSNAATPEPLTSSAPSSAPTVTASQPISASSGADASFAPSDGESTPADKSSAMNVDAPAPEKLTSSTESATTVTPTATTVPSILGSSKSSAFSAPGAAALANPHSKEAVQANSVAFYQCYRSRVATVHEKLIAQVSAQRRLVMAALPAGLLGGAANPAGASAPPSQNDLILALALRHLASLTSWSAKLDKLGKSEFSAVAAAVQTVPALRSALATENTSQSPLATNSAASQSATTALNAATASANIASPAGNSSATAASENASNPEGANTSNENNDNNKISAKTVEGTEEGVVPTISGKAASSAFSVPAPSSLSSSESSLLRNSNGSAASAIGAGVGSPSVSPFTALLHLWNSAPRKHLASISALFNAICMLKDFDVLNGADFASFKFEDSTSTSAAVAAAAAAAAANAAAVANPLASLLAGLSPSAAAAVAAATNPLGSPLTAWGSSPLPAWSPVPSPLTTFPGPYGSLSPITFVTRASPLPGLATPTSSASASGGANTTFSSTLPQGSLIRPGSASAPRNFAGFSGSDGSSSGISLLGGRSAFGALKRAAEEEAENDIVPKRAKLAEH